MKAVTLTLLLSPLEGACAICAKGRPMKIALVLLSLPLLAQQGSEPDSKFDQLYINLLESQIILQSISQQFQEAQLNFNQAKKQLEEFCKSKDLILGQSEKGRILCKPKATQIQPTSQGVAQ